MGRSPLIKQRKRFRETLSASTKSNVTRAGNGDGAFQTGSFLRALLRFPCASACFRLPHNASENGSSR